MDKEGIYKLIQKCFICQLKREGFWKKRFKSQHIKEINKKCVKMKLTKLNTFQIKTKNKIEKQVINFY